jgi:hypothetical protein
MPRIDLDILNQKQTPAFYASSLATRPAASFVGRIFIDSDSPSTGLYRDTGTAWVQIADPGAGTTGTLQQVTTNGSSTTVGISVTSNGIGIGTAIPGANILDIHGTTGVLAQLENTTTQNSLLSFRNQGAGVWSIGNGYNAAANDFIIYDAVSFVNRFTIKSTGQTFIGSNTTSSGLFVVNNATSDSHIVVLGANGPSLRFRNAGIGSTLNTGLGISTATNNFIQGSASGDYCIFNSSTTASPILFGVYNSGASQTQEAARISASRNFLINTTTDAGFAFDVNGTARIYGNSTFTGATDNIISFIGNATTQLFSIRNNSATSVNLNTQNSARLILGVSTGTSSGSTINHLTIFSTGNCTINSGTDAGYKLDISGTLRVSSGNGSRFEGGGSFVATGICNFNGAAQAVSGTNVTRLNAQTDLSIGFIGGASTSSILEIQSTTLGFLPPRMTTAQKNAIATPATGLVVFDTTLAKLCVFSTTWQTITSV